MNIHKEGLIAKVEIWNYLSKKSDFLDCKITSIVSALDRDYRVNVTLENGKEIRECAPECVIIKSE